MTSVWPLCVKYQKASSDMTTKLETAMEFYALDIILKLETAMEFYALDIILENWIIK